MPPEPSRTRTSPRTLRTRISPEPSSIRAESTS
jgi:hypothetical protein